MKAKYCGYCGHELQENDQKCPFCGALLEEALPTPGEAPVGQSGPGTPGAVASAGQPAAAPQKKKSPGKLIGIAAAVAAVLGIGIFAASKLGEKDPKEVVISAFENIYTEDQVKPMEELFGFSKFQENAGSSQEADMKIMLKDCSMDEAKLFAGAGFKVSSQYDQESKKSAGNLAALYGGMDLVNLDFYFGDNVFMAAIPELSSKVFTLDTSEGLAQRVMESPVLGPVFQYSDLDLEEAEDFYREYIHWIQKKAEDGSAADPYGLADALERYKKGCKAQADFKEALTVTKGEKYTFEVDGKEVSCKGYEVNISKDSLINFLRTSSDFFLEDQELKDNFLEHLQMSFRMLELSGIGIGNTAFSGMSAEEMLDQNYEEMKVMVEEAIDELDAVLNDVDMVVHVDKKGRLVSVEGSTTLTDEEDEADIQFSLRLEGGSYLTQNAWGKAEISGGGDAVTVEFTKSGSYDGKTLSGDLSLTLCGMEEDLTLDLSGFYDSDGGDFTMSADVVSKKEKLLELSAEGIVSELEKGSVIHMDFDEIRLDMPGEDALFISFDGEYDLRPLSGEVAELEGEKLDVIGATEEDWQDVIMEIYMGVMDLNSQFQSIGN